MLILNFLYNISINALNIVALQKAFWQNNVFELPVALQVDPVLCPPSTCMFTLEKDNNHFEIMGRLSL